MANGLLGRARLAAATITQLGQPVDAGKVKVVNINMVNCGATDALVRIAVSTSAILQDADWLEYDAKLAPAGTNANVIERTAVILSGGERVFVYASTANVSAVAYAMERLA
ncbi:hypothetical protein SAMN02745857_01782 [Andreprevotia lacus DSM 23236]|jgi:hypothetical protein|uniref:Uncharacterized protein n=1 Tax=Andreprevotia lacus DSM 23236 TaxID=1121001 RepID=A0A1W1XJT9_9NEIS|nr:hypothetical protein [Andreprevotia lacus]SMC24239.1 hypothetical protein SAMN02745857_01782 [Andreprevotia lacus DSM 23236]